MAIDKKIVRLAFVSGVRHCISRRPGTRPLMAHKMVSKCDRRRLRQQDCAARCRHLRDPPPGRRTSPVVVSTRIEFEMDIQPVAVDRRIRAPFLGTTKIPIKNRFPLRQRGCRSGSQIRSGRCRPTRFSMRTSAMKTPWKLAIVILRIKLHRHSQRPHPGRTFQPVRPTLDSADAGQNNRRKNPDNGHHGQKLNQRKAGNPSPGSRQKITAIQDSPCACPATPHTRTAKPASAKSGWMAPESPTRCSPQMPK